MESIPIQKILFLDIETVPANQDFQSLDERWRKLWELKAEIIGRYREGENAESLYNRAGIYAEFGKIVCISVGVPYMVDQSIHLRVKSFASDNEHDILTGFSELLNQSFGKKLQYLCAHNGKEFDFPYICRRLLTNKLPLPPGLKVMGKKPWDLHHLLDTMQLWAFGDYKSYTSLDVMAAVFNIPTPKDDISGKDIHKVYYADNDLPRIAHYCEKDVVALFNIYLSMMGMSPISNDFVEKAPEE